MLLQRWSSPTGPPEATSAGASPWWRSCRSSRSRWGCASGAAGEHVKPRMSDPAPNPPRRRRWQWEALGLVASMAMVLVAYYPVAFGGKTFDTSALVAGVNGNDPPTGVPPLQVVDPIRPDRGAGAWQMTPWPTATHQQYPAGHEPLWNPSYGFLQRLSANLH